MGRVKAAITPCPDCQGDGYREVRVHGRGAGLEGIEPLYTLTDCVTCGGRGEVLDAEEANPSYGAWLEESAEDAALETSALIHQSREEEQARHAALESRQPQASKPKSAQTAA